MNYEKGSRMPSGHAALRTAGLVILVKGVKSLSQLFLFPVGQRAEAANTGYPPAYSIVPAPSTTCAAQPRREMLVRGASTPG
jgi:hypothetical protein